MVNITSAAHAAVKAYSAAIALGGNYSVPLPSLASEISSFFLPNYTSFTLGTMSISPNQSVVAENFISLYTEWRTSGPGTDVKVEHSRVEVVSNESALCWMTFRVFPQTADIQGWDWTNVYGFHLVEEGLENGLSGGWEFALADNEELEYAKRYPNATA